MVPSVEYIEMKLQLEVPTTWTAEPLADGRRRYVVPGSLTPAADLVVLCRESLPLPLDLLAWPLAALGQLKTTLLAALPAALGSSGPGAATWRVQVQSSAALTTTSGWPATVTQATLVDERDQPVAGCVAVLYRFLTYGAEAIIVFTDRTRFAPLRESLLSVLATGRAQWPTAEPPSLYHLLHDEPTGP